MVTEVKDEHLDLGALYITQEAYDIFAASGEHPSDFILLHARDVRQNGPGSKQVSVFRLDDNAWIRIVTTFDKTPTTTIDSVHVDTRHRLERTIH